MRVLVVGGGAREHALCLALAADPAVTALVCAPGNAGTAMVAEQRPLAVGDPAAVAALAADLRSDLVVIGPEVPLVAGAADAVRAAGTACFGPGAAAARLEGSKSFAKEVMAAAGVPTAGARSCATALEVEAALDAFGPPYVVKDDGLAAGKGVVVTEDRDAAREHAAACRGPVVVEEYLDGPEVSLFCVTDGDTVLPLLPAQDAKRVGDGDTGPNTGGMGAYSPLPWAPPELVEEVLDTVVEPTLAELRRRGSPSPACCTSASRSPRPAPGWSSSTCVSATRRRRSCSRCWRPRWPACCTPPPPALSPRTRRCTGGPARR